MIIEILLKKIVYFIASDLFKRQQMRIKGYKLS